jgi:hypothetical protein
MVDSETWWGCHEDGKRLCRTRRSQISSISPTYKRQQDLHFGLIDRIQNQATSLFLSPPGSLAIIKQLGTIKSLQDSSTDWTSLKPFSRYTASSASGKGISLLQIFVHRRLGWAISSRDALARVARTSSGPTWRPLGSRLPSLHAPSRVLHQIVVSGEATSADTRRRFRL